MNHDESVARCGVDDDAPFILTATGAKLFFLDPSPHAISLVDICHHTGMLCRFTGATSQFYSVAQHSLHVGRIVKNMLDEEGVDRDIDYWDQILAALLHDAEEAYVNDLSSPLKSAVKGKYKWIANGIRNAIYEKYGIDRAYHNQIVKDADNIAILVERYHFMPKHPDWPGATDIEMRAYPKPEFKDPRQASNDFGLALRMAFANRKILRAE
jgi:5'-deoxynucleotidase YfbR-like HD superfamily hydrolase